MGTIKDLTDSRDALVLSVLQEWRSGGYPSFEAMLIDLAVRLMRGKNECMAMLASAQEGKSK